MTRVGQGLYSARARGSWCWRITTGPWREALGTLVDTRAALGQGMLLTVGVCATVGQLFLTKAFRAGPPAKVSVVALTQAGFG